MRTPAPVAARRARPRESGGKMPKARGFAVAERRRWRNIAGKQAKFQKFWRPALVTPHVTPIAYNKAIKKRDRPATGDTQSQNMIGARRERRE